MKRRYVLFGVLLLALVLLVGMKAPAVHAAGPSFTPVCPQRTYQSGPDAEQAITKIFFPFATSPCNYPFQVPFQNEWMGSGHADKTAEAFNDWNDSDTKTVPVGCAKCHSTPGYRDYIGADGSPANTGNTVDVAPPIGTTVECVACHNNVTSTKTTVTFPSGVTLTGLGDESRCMECHQGRESMESVKRAIAAIPPSDTDVVSPTLATGGVRLHYLAAAATFYGSEVRAGYEYTRELGVNYDVKFNHVEGYDTCIECHDPHTLQIKLSECKTCHTNVQTADDFAKIRMAGSLADYDGDGNVTEGVGQEIDGLREKLWTAVRAYASQVSGKAICFDGSRFYVDTNDNGTCDTGESTRYNAFTPRLLKATHNYYIVANAPAQFVHGGKYIIQLAYDSIMDLNPKINPPVDMANAHRGDPGHFNGSQMAWRDWDADPAVPGSCARCHSAEGVPFFKKEGVNVSAKQSNGLMCSTCHANVGGDWARIKFADITFPSGAKLSLAAQDGDGDSNLCLFCHQGRAWSGSIATAIAGKELDTPTTALRFTNVHYFAAGATLFGNDAKGIYQFEGKTYRNRFAHVPDFDACTECHGVHELNVKETRCTMCHGAFASLQDIRFATSFADYDGDGNLTEGLYYEIETMAEKLYTALKAYGVAVGKPIVYDAHAYPYFFNDTNGNGVKDADETTSYNGFTPRSLRAAYNYQYYQKDPGQFAHNGKYVLQALYDNLEDLGASPQIDVDMTGLVRP